MRKNNPPHPRQKRQCSLFNGTLKMDATHAIALDKAGVFFCSLLPLLVPQDLYKPVAEVEQLQRGDHERNKGIMRGEP